MVSRLDCEAYTQVPLELHPGKSLLTVIDERCGHIHKNSTNSALLFSKVSVQNYWIYVHEDWRHAKQIGSADYVWFEFACYKLDLSSYSGSAP